MNINLPILFHSTRFIQRVRFKNPFQLPNGQDRTEIVLPEVSIPYFRVCNYIDNDFVCPIPSRVLL